MVSVRWLAVVSHVGLMLGFDRSKAAVGDETAASQAHATETAAGGSDASVAPSDQLVQLSRYG